MTEITHEDVAQRLIRALRLDTAMGDRERGALRAKILWPDYLHDRADLNSQAENAIWLKQVEMDAARVRSWDTKAARDDYLEVMGWIVELGRLGLESRRRVRKRRERSLSLVEFIRRVALDWDFKTIGHRDGTNDEGARRRWNGVIVVTADVANGRIGGLVLRDAAGLERRKEMV